jgi:hypothetical protein
MRRSASSLSPPAAGLHAVAQASDADRPVWRARRPPRESVFSQSDAFVPECRSLLTFGPSAWRSSPKTSPNTRLSLSRFWGKRKMSISCRIRRAPSAKALVSARTSCPDVLTCVGPSPLFPHVPPKPSRTVPAFSPNSQRRDQG